MIKMNCPTCDHGLRIANKFSGKRGKCKYCLEYFIVSGEQFDTPYGDDEETQRDRRRKEQQIDEMAQAQRLLAEARAVEAAKVREREDRRSRRILTAGVLLIIGALAGGGYWYMRSTGQEIPGVYLPEEQSAAAPNVQSETLSGVPVPVFGDSPEALDVSIEWSAAFEGVENDSVTCYRISVSSNYDDTVSNIQLALTQLGWDYSIWMDENPVPHTELHGEVKGKRAAVRIEEVMDEVHVYAGILTE